MKGKVWKFGDNVNTDEIIPARYLNVSDPATLAKHCMEDADAEFSEKVSKGDIIVAGENFGCGSSREHAPIAIKAAGLSCCIAKSFARIFFRNAINIGLPIMESAQAAEEITPGEEIEVDPQKGLITRLSTGQTYQVEPFSDEIQQIISAGGLMSFVKKQAAKSV